jgi:hypothetical protein
MTRTSAEKTVGDHIETIESAGNVTSPTLEHQNTDDPVDCMRNTGEEVGMTWRSIAAAVVSWPFPSIIPSHSWLRPRSQDHYLH